MMHGFTEAEWMAYVDQELAPPDRARLEAHLKDCPDCRRMCGELLTGHRLFSESALRLGEELHAAGEEVDRVVALGMLRLNEAPLLNRIDQLLLALAPICGSAAAERSMRMAALDAANSSVHALTESHWPDFVSHLSANVALFCGCAAGSLIARTGAQLAANALSTLAPGEVV